MSPFTTRHRQSHIMKLSTKLPIVSEAKVSLFPQSVFSFIPSRLYFPIIFFNQQWPTFSGSVISGASHPPYNSFSQKSSHFSTISQHTHSREFTYNEIKKNLNSSSSFPGVPFLLSPSFSA